MARANEATEARDAEIADKPKIALDLADWAAIAASNEAEATMPRPNDATDERAALNAKAPATVRALAD